MQTCASSPGGVFSLLERKDDGSYMFGGLCVLEIKTQSALGTVDAIYYQSLNGNMFTECSAGTELFKSTVCDSPYQAQLYQHVPALVKRVLIADNVPGVLPHKVVLVPVSDKQQHTLLSM